MSINYKHPIIITNQAKNSLIESDCACADVLAGPVSSLPELTDLTEADCACAASPATPHSKLEMQEDVFSHAPSLHRASLPDSHELVVNPLGYSAMAVLNQPAKHVLDAFEKPMQISELVNKVTDISAPEVIHTAKELAALGFIVTRSQPVKPSLRATTLTAWLHMTNDCNLRCDYCYVKKSAEKMSLDRGKQSVDAIFRSALANHFQQVKIKYAGGEPTLVFQRIIALQDYAQTVAAENGLSIDGVVLSNGVALSDRMIRTLQVHNLRLSISLDGVADDHDAQRRFTNGKGSFTHLERTLDRLEKHNFKPSVTITVSKRNLSGLSETIGYVLQRGLPFTINFYRENDCSVSCDDLRFSDQIVIQALREAYSVIEKDLPAFSLLSSILDRARLDGYHEHPCGVGNSYLVIDQNGGIAKCHMDLQQTISDVNAEDPLQEIRKDLSGVDNINVNQKETCKDCQWRYWCAGGCPLLTHGVTGRWDTKSPNCEIYKTLFPEVLHLEGLRLLKWGSQERAH